MRKLVFSFALVAALIGLLSGCQSVNTIQRADPLASPTLVDDTRIITDASLSRNLQIISINESVVSGDLLKIQATLQNIKKTPRTVRYRFEWIRADGMEQSSPAHSWRTLTLQGGEVRSISGIGPSPRIRDFRLKLQENP